MQTLYHDAQLLAEAMKDECKRQMEIAVSDDDWQIAARNFAAANAIINLLQPHVNRESFDNRKERKQ